MQQYDAKTALVVVDVQNDFLPGGALPVPHGDEVVETINAMIPHFRTVFATQDWHPLGHVSFASSHAGCHPGDCVDGQALWPDHCVQGTRGAAIAQGLALPASTRFVRKGFLKDVDSYSGFGTCPGHEGEGLAAGLRTLGVEQVFVAGLALDFCVQATAIDAARSGFRTILVLDACRGIDVDGSVARALAACRQAGVAVRNTLEGEDGL